jgi:voltage-gated sodium channel
MAEEQEGVKAETLKALDRKDSRRDTAFHDTRSTAAIKNVTIAASKKFDRLKKAVFKDAPSELTDSDKKLQEIAEVIRTYRGVDLEVVAKDKEAVPWYDSPEFDIAICLVVLLNIVMIGVEMDMGDDNRQGYDRDVVWIVVQWLFCVIFFVEIGIKVYYYTWRWFQLDPWSWLALGVALLSFVDVAILMPLKQSGQLRIFSLVRCIVLLRLIKVIQRSKILKELELVMRGLVNAGATLAWALAIIVFLLYIFGVWTTTLIGHSEAYEVLFRLFNGWDNLEYFGTIGRSMFTLFQMMTLDAWSSELLRPAFKQEWYLVFLFMPFIMLTSFGILNVILSVLIEQTVTEAGKSDMSRKREEGSVKSTRDILKELFLLSDTGCTEALTLKAFNKAAAEDGEVVWRLRQLEIEADEVRRLFKVIDGNGSRTLDIKEFVEGCTKLKGTAQSKHLLALQNQADAMALQMDALGKQLRYTERMLAMLDDISKRMKVRFQPSMESSRREMNERNRGRAPTQELPIQKNGGTRGLNLAATNQPRLPNLPTS